MIIFFLLKTKKKVVSYKCNMSENTNTNLVVFLDTIGRTIIGKAVTQDDTTVSVENPALVAVQPNVQTGQIQLQILPLFFREFQADRNVATVWHYKKDSITFADSIVFVDQFVNQYNQLFAPVVAPAETAEEAPVVKLFDSES